MRIQNIQIRHWRHFTNISLNVPLDAPLVCLVGGNGTGKTHIFELIAASAHRIGLAEGFEALRGDPYSENAEFLVQFYIAPNAVPTLDDPAAHIPAELFNAHSTWDRTLILEKTSNTGTRITAGGVSNLNEAVLLAQFLVDQIRTSRLIHYLMLDADRAYPRLQVQPHEFATAFDTDWGSLAKSRSFAQTKSLYEEWFRYLFGTENRENNAHIQAIRRAREQKLPEPAFIDVMEGYKNSLQSVLPHLLFTGIDAQKKQISFDTTGIPLTFNQLSGGEREIAFLIGQIERFGLRKGLLLVDEPELHLNYDLLRSWIGFLKSTVEDGQIWLATHSLEVVEVTGQDSTFLLERDTVTRKVIDCAPIASRPVLGTLSRAVGSPAFSIANLTFLFVEGEEEIGERERFRLLTSAPRDVRFLEAGNCREVIRRSDNLKKLAEESGEPLKLGGILDGDWRSTAEKRELESVGLHVLQVHEVENFLLHPPTMMEVISSIGGDPSSYDAKLQSAADRRAGSAIFDSARTQKEFAEFPPPHSDVRTLVHELQWNDFVDLDVSIKKIVESDTNLNDDQRSLLSKHLKVRARIYERVRKDGSLWKVCEGKEVFRSLSSAIGFSDADIAERAVISAWMRSPHLIPAELIALRQYIEHIRRA